jgi:hypothetical protein
VFCLELFSIEAKEKPAILDVCFSIVRNMQEFVGKRLSHLDSYHARVTPNDNYPTS